MGFRQLEDAVDDAEDDSEFYATQVVAYNRLYLVQNAAKVTGWKAVVLVHAMVTEVIAVAAIARSLWLTL